MRKMRLATLLIAFIMVFSVFFGCNKKEGSVSSGVVSEPTISEPATETNSASVPGKQLPGSSSKPQDSQPPKDKGGALSTIVTSDKAFNKVFAKNPIDAAYLKDVEKATSNVDMVNLAEKYTKLWQKEIEAGYKKLIQKAPAAKKEAYKQVQANWEKETPAELKKIADKAQAAGGSVAQVETAGQTMEYYRARANKIYVKLYALDKKFTYAYTGK